MRYPGRHAAPSAATTRAGGFLAALAVTVALALVGPSAARAQDAVRNGALPPDHALVLRPAPSVRALAEEVREILTRRTTLLVVIGEATPEGAPDLVNEGEVGIALMDARTTSEILDGAARSRRSLRVVLGGPDRVTYATELTTSDAEPPSARSIALAVLALRDSALVGRNPASWPDPNAPAYVYRVPADGPLGPLPRLTPSVRPAFELRLLLGASLAHGSALAGLGAGVGVCIRRDCLLLEADLPLLFDDDRGGSSRLDYRPSVLGLRVQIAPILVGDVSFGFAFGPVLRVGNLHVGRASNIVATPGMRGTLLVAWHFVPRFEWLLELGIDAALQTASFATAGGTWLREEVVTPWAVLALRIRP